MHQKQVSVLAASILGACLANEPRVEQCSDVAAMCDKATAAQCADEPWLKRRCCASCTLLQAPAANRTDTVIYPSSGQVRKVVHRHRCSAGGKDYCFRGRFISGRTKIVSPARREVIPRQDVQIWVSGPIEATVVLALNETDASGIVEDVETTAYTNKDDEDERITSFSLTLRGGQHRASVVWRVNGTVISNLKTVFFVGEPDETGRDQVLQDELDSVLFQYFMPCRMFMAENFHKLRRWNYLTKYHLGHGGEFVCHRGACLERSSKELLLLSMELLDRKVLMDDGGGTFNIKGVSNNLFLDEASPDFLRLATSGGFTTVHSTAIPRSARNQRVPCHSENKHIKQHTTCAVVGSSANLLDSGYGSAIDFAEAIFRVNAAPTAGFEVDVGSRTDYHVGAEDPDDGAVSVRIDRAVETSEFEETSILLDLLLATCPKSGCILINNGIIRQLLRWFNELLEVAGSNHSFADYDRNVSTGFYTVAAAMAMCQHVDLYGFGLGLSPKRFVAWKTAASFSKEDEGKGLEITKDHVRVGEFHREVYWGALSRPNVTWGDAKVLNVEPKIRGKVTLDNGITFENPEKGISNDDREGGQNERLYDCDASHVYARYYTIDYLSEYCFRRSDVHRHNWHIEHAVLAALHNLGFLTWNRAYSQ